MWIPYFTFLGSTMVSYTRARAEGLGIECKVGFMQRAERMILLVLGSLIGTLFKVFDPAMITVLAAIAVISNITAIERTLLVKKIEKQRNKDKEV
jgi:CDP-diacylglycerol--glycerol-3-phosphate 3-phosphatidyltransferase